MTSRVVRFLEAVIPAPLHIGPTSRVDPQPGPLPIPASHNGAIRLCRPCEFASAETTCYLCGEPMTD